MSAVDEKLLLGIKLEFCQALSSKGKAFKFSLSTGSNFCFSLDTREEAPVLDTKMMASTKKKPTPSTLQVKCKAQNF